MDADHLRMIMGAGQLAPSADNCQPWYFAVENELIFLFHDIENTHSNHIYNMDFFADFVSLGAVLENIHRQAEALGYETKIELRPYDKNGPFAEISFKQKNNPHVNRKKLPLHQRKTNRGPYSKEPVPDEIKNWAQKLTAKRGMKMHWIDSPDDIEKFSHIISSHDIILWEDPELRKNLLRMLRFGGKKHADGLHIDSLELGLKKHLFRPAIFAASKFPLIWKMLAIGSVLHTRNTIRKSAGLVAIVSPLERHPHVYAEGGRLLQSLWLEFSKQGISVQPLFGPIAFILNGQLHKGGLSKKHENIRKKIHHHFSSKFKGVKNGVFVAFFRIGYAKKPSLDSGRKKLAEVLKTKS